MDSILKESCSYKIVNMINDVISRSSRLRIIPLSLSSSCVTGKKTARKQ